jgi:hypothetical protein
MREILIRVVDSRTNIEHYSTHNSNGHLVGLCGVLMTRVQLAAYCKDFSPCLECMLRRMAT